MPWDSDGKISGAMELLADGKLYRIPKEKQCVQALKAGINFDSV